MNITEANAVNTLLDHLLNLPDGTGTVPDDDKARTAAAVLADRANNALHAGVTGEDVQQSWPES